MILLDAHPVVAYLGGEYPTSDEVEPLLRRAAITTINAAEAIDTLVRQHDVDPDEAIADVRQLGIHTVVVRAYLAEEAALLRAKHYHRTLRPVSLADCVAAASALWLPQIEALATGDRALLDLVHAEGGSVIPLPDSSGNVWSPAE